MVQVQPALTARRSVVQVRPALTERRSVVQVRPTLTERRSVVQVRPTLTPRRSMVQVRPALTARRTDPSTADFYPTTVGGPSTAGLVHMLPATTVVRSQIVKCYTMRYWTSCHFHAANIANAKRALSNNMRILT